MRHAREHGGALLDRALDARLHFDEGQRRAPHLARAARAVIRHVAALAEGFRGVGQPQDRPDLVAQEQDRDGQQHQRGADHPEQEDLRIRRISGAARREHPHHVAVELDADFDQRRLSDGVDPERPPDLLAQFHRQGLVEQREERLRPGGGMSVAGRKSTHEAELLLRDPPDLLVSRRPADSCDRPRSARRCRRPRRRTSFCVTRFQCRSMNTKATTDCRITIGAMMISSARA